MATAQVSGFRPDVEGLRGIAVAIVVLFHAGAAVVPGGFIGVDVFFVISGFLITGLLIREHERTGRIRLAAFYARRVRRLLPAGMVALAATLVASFAVLSPLDLPKAAADGASAALSVGNIRFALQAGDYFASVKSPSPFLHFWSLAVEEQFYLVWPALIVGAAIGARARLGTGLALAAVIVASFLANIVVTDAAVNWAFYSLPTRAWQLGLGGLIALVAERLDLVPWPIRACLGWVGLAAVLASAVVFDGSMAYPGAYALAPTLGAGALIVAGLTRGGPGRLLSLGPIRFLGRISYSLYLWSWPILVIGAAAGWSPVGGTVVLVGGAVVVAWASWRVIEEPFRHGFPSLSRRPSRTILAGATVAVLVATMAGSLAAWGPARLPTSAATIADIDTEEPLDLSPSPSAPMSPPPASEPGNQSASPSPPASPLPEPTPTPRPTQVIRLPSDVRPSLGRARYDEERLRGDGCLAFERVTVPPHCVYGDPRASITVALVGDSHASQWFPAVERIARARDWRILTFVKVACPFVDMRIRNVALKREYRECRAWNEAVVSKLSAARPDLTIVSMSRFAIHPILQRDTTVAAQGAAIARLIDRLPGLVALIVDTPEAGIDVPSCLARHPNDVRACAIPCSVAFSGHLGQIEAVAARATGSALVDLTDRICRDDPCPVVVDGRIVFRDTRHLTATFSRWLAGDLDRGLAVILLPG